MFSKPCDVGRLPIKGKLGWGWRECGRRDKAETGMEQGDVGVYGGGGGGWAKINKSDSLYLSA